MCKSPKVLATLMAFGVDIKLSEEAKWPILHFAFSYESGDTSWIPVFRQYGIDINAVVTDRKTALVIEIENLNTSTANALVDNEAKWRQQEETPELIAAIKFGRPPYSLFSLLCKRHKRHMPEEEYRTYINSPGLYGSSPVHVAAKQYSNEILKFLWLEGANMNVKDKQGRNALSYALESRLTMELLVKVCGIDPNEGQTDQEYTPAHITVRTLSDPTIIEEALQVRWGLGANFNIKDKAGNTSLSIADARMSQFDPWYCARIQLHK
ncbi:uncharacterized protein DFL_004900 [Arthrobotrys flagrans]|uniref:Uncharacterized protein n=1 Tax=Arthrobotrys flagrans TaxID=97331 RepID=A0A437A5Z8_ARTFL|nr:hypothetical protein DFL_004900 [Arthrobotrys flagrans]